MSISLSVLLVLFMGSIQIQGQNILEIHARTDPNDPNGMSNAGVSVSITNKEGLTCVARKLEEQGDTFLPGEIDAFHGQQIGNCSMFPVPNNEVTAFQVTHEGSDGVWVLWYRILFDDGTYTVCPEGVHIDDDEIHDLICP